MAEDTASLVASSVAEATQVADTEPIAGDETPEVAPEASAEAPAAEAATGEEAPAEAAVPLASEPKKKRGPIPYDRHEAVLTRARGEAEKARKELQDRIDALSKYESEDIQTRLKLMDLLESDPSRAIAVLKQSDPDRFAKLSWAEEVAAAAAAASAAPAGGEKPQPDTLNPDGTMGYSADRAEQLVEWILAKERTESQKQIEALRKEISPIKEEREARERFQQSVQRMTPVLESARKSWPKFTENEAEIRAFLEKNPTANLHDAYIGVVMPKFETAVTEAETNSRKKVIAELNAKGKATGVIPGKIPAAGATDGDGEPRSTADLVRAALKSAA